MEKARAKAKLQLTSEQRLLFEEVKTFVLESLPSPSADASLALPAKYPARDRLFLSTLANKLRLSCSFDEFDDETDEPLIVLRFGEDVVFDSEDENDGGEARQAVDRVLAAYDKAPTIEDASESDFEDEYAKKLAAKHIEWKHDYYRVRFARSLICWTEAVAQEKLEFDARQPDKLHDLAYRYIEGLQWVLHYYYDGVVSWGWFYDYHYAPKISDLRGIGDFVFNFNLGQPFRPFEQLMGVLPDLSNAIIPDAYRDLMSDPASPIIDFYPRDFVQDLNGKKAEFEAIVKIPFIDEHRLLKTMKSAFTLPLLGKFSTC